MMAWTQKLSSGIRAVLRNTAQSVTVVTSYMPKEHSIDSNSVFHGATLSSFSSIALDPHPLISFSLRVPSRMASSLQSADPNVPVHLILNILSATQANTAVKFAGPSQHPHPFQSSPYSLSEEGIPILHDSLGAFSCKLVCPPWKLHNLDALDHRRRLDQADNVPWEGTGVASELYIARIVRVENVPVSEGDNDNPLRALPLVYYRQGYTTPNPVHCLVKK